MQEVFNESDDSAKDGEIDLPEILKTLDCDTANNLFSKTCLEKEEEHYDQQPKDHSMPTETLKLEIPSPPKNSETKIHHATQNMSELETHLLSTIKHASEDRETEENISIKRRRTHSPDLSPCPSDGSPSQIHLEKVSFSNYAAEMKELRD